MIMFGIIGKIVVMPIRAINVPIKATKAIFDALSDEPVRFEKNKVDDIADVVEESIKNLKGK